MAACPWRWRVSNPSVLAGPAGSSSDLAKPDAPYRVIDAFAHHQSRSAARGGYVLGQVRPIDGVPQEGSLVHSSVVIQLGILAEVGFRVAERGLAQPEESVDVPTADVTRGSVDVEGEIEEVADGQPGAPISPRAWGL